jgi:hypothetical protein
MWLNLCPLKEHLPWQSGPLPDEEMVTSVRQRLDKLNGRMTLEQRQAVANAAVFNMLPTWFFAARGICRLFEEDEREREALLFRAYCADWAAGRRAVKGASGCVRMVAQPSPSADRLQQDVWHVVVIDGDQEAAPVLVHDFELDGVEIVVGPDTELVRHGIAARFVAGGIALLILVVSRHGWVCP